GRVRGVPGQGQRGVAPVRVALGFGQAVRGHGHGDSGTGPQAGTSREALQIVSLNRGRVALPRLVTTTAGASAPSGGHARVPVSCPHAGVCEFAQSALGGWNRRAFSRQPIGSRRRAGATRRARFFGAGARTCRLSRVYISPKARALLLRRGDTSCGTRLAGLP